MKILKTIGISLAVLIAVVIVLSIIAPKAIDVHREVVINAPAEVIWKDIATFDGFNKWSPFQKMDPNQTVKLEGTDGTIGAKQSWKGQKTGEGSMTISKLDPNKTVEYDLFFNVHGGSHSLGFMNMDKADGGYKVTWGVKMSMPMPYNAIGLFVNLDKMMGKDFESGLADLKKLCESQPAYNIVEANFEEKNCAAIRDNINMSDIAAFLGKSYGKIGEAIAKAGAKPGIPMAIYYTWDEQKKTTDMAAAIPVDAKKNFGKDVKEVNIPASSAYKIDYFGAYAKMKSAYDAMDAKMKELGKKPDLVIEEYLNDPMVEKDTAKWHTAIYFLVKKEAPVASSK